MEGINRLEMDCERALQEGKLQGLVAVFYQNERPLKGLAGLMDWRFHGLISRCIQVGALVGKAGECAYLPFPGPDRVYHLILIGGGPLSRSGKRGLLPEDACGALKKNLKSLQLGRIGVSRAEFGGLDEDDIAKRLKGASFWILP